MKLLELFNKPGHYKWYKKTSTLWKGEFKLGGITYGFTSDFLTHHEDEGVTWEVFFTIETPRIDDAGHIQSKFLASETGNEVEVFSTVLAMLTDFASNVQPDLIMVSASLKEPSRIKLYKRMAKRAGLMGYKLLEDYEWDNESHLFVFQKEEKL